ncbi:putative RNA-directed DNA polymerase [Helianthus debilis subsp. tardiflorus]
MTGNDTVKTDVSSSEHGSPYYLHPSDYPRQMHVNDTLTDNNYLDWVQEMENFLFAKNKIGFIDGTLKKPKETDANHMAWKRCDAMIKGWLTTAMDKEIRGSVKFANSAAEIWTDLRERFGKESAPRAYELKQLISNTKQDGMTVSAYYTKLRGLWDEMQSFLPTPKCLCSGCTCGIGKSLRELREKEQLYEFLMGLDGEFTTIRTQILATKPTPTLGNAYHLVAEDGQQRSITGGRRIVNEAAAFQATVKRNAGSSKTIQKDEKPTGHCDFCGRDGHTRDGCFKRIGYPEWWPGKNKREKSRPRAACIEVEDSPVTGLTKEQYEQFLKHFAPEDKPVKNDVPRGLRSRKLIGVGKCMNGLYQMGMFGKTRKAMLVTKETWHKRLGHAGDEKLSKINDLSNFSFKNNGDVCDSCIKSKLTRKPFPISTTRTSACFELLHCDIWGKYRTPTLSKANYFLTIVDDYSRSVWVFLLKHKYEASTCLINFHKLIQTQFERNVKRIRCDNGGEFVSNHMLSFYAEQGIILETSCPHTPQQNGVVERKHRHLLETARALKVEAKLPIRFWGECILTATYIINRLPSKVIGGKTPFELLYGEKPSYDHMRIFGCMAYYRSIEAKSDKFEIRGKPGVFMGYPNGTKGYKIYDPNSGKIVISRDVTFAEKVFPFAIKTKGCETKEEDVFGFPLVENGPTKNNEKKMEDLDLGLNNQTTQPERLEHIELEELGFNGPTEQEINVESPRALEEMNDTVGNLNKEANENAVPVREARNKSRPARLNDYEVQLPPSIDHAQTSSSQQSSTVFPLANFVSYDNFTDSHKAFLTAISSNDEPKNYNQAVQIQEWRDAMKTEIKALEENGTWTLEDLPDGKRPIDSKWVYKIKYKPNGEIERYKARLVAKGYTQMEGVNYHDTFAPVAKLVTVRSLLAIAIKKEWTIHQLDVNNAFLHGDLNEEVYMRIPPGYDNDKGGEAKVCRLRKSLYGLKQASRNWYQKFTSALLDLDFKQSYADHSLFIYKSEDVFVAALIYVDDVIVVGNNQDRIQKTKDYLNNKFSIKDLGPLKYFLGIEAARTKDGMVLSQRKYTLDILEDSGMLGCRPCSFPMEPNQKLEHHDGALGSMLANIEGLLEDYYTSKLPDRILHIR